MCVYTASVSASCGEGRRQGVGAGDTIGRQLSDLVLPAPLALVRIRREKPATLEKANVWTKEGILFLKTVDVIQNTQEVQIK